MKRNRLLEKPHAKTLHKIRMLIIYQAQGAPDAWIAKKLGYKNVNAVYQLRSRDAFKIEAERAKENLLKKGWQAVSKKSNKFTDLERITLKILYDEGKTDYEIADIMKRNRVTINRQRKALELPCNYGADKSTLALILRLYNDGHTYTYIAESAGMNVGVIGRVVKSKYAQTDFSDTEPTFETSEWGDLPVYDQDMFLEIDPTCEHEAAD